MDPATARIDIIKQSMAKAFNHVHVRHEQNKVALSRPTTPLKNGSSISTTGTVVVQSRTHRLLGNHELRRHTPHHEL
ncbi:hypothetical protein V6N13_106185 [Hibiscus sabdariffa]|uniref:Uncharacterized protein n=1 Tax=Hibiscus sabdariffa TaxID=183260 RepID=A0ABR2EZZ4_9ROSI